jgi:hypothetical protein
MATLQELKEREVGFLNSHNSRYIEYGKACKDILNKCKNYAGSKLSENILITEMAEEYANQEKKYYALTKNEVHRLHIKLASEYYFKDFLTFNEIYKLLEKEERILSFEEAKNILIKDQEKFNRIQPKILKNVLEFIELNVKNSTNY